MSRGATPVAFGLHYRPAIIAIADLVFRQLHADRLDREIKDQERRVRIGRWATARRTVPAMVAEAGA